MSDFPLFPEQASSLASQVDDLYLFELGIAVFMTVLICLLIVSFAVVYRRRSRADRSSPPVASRLMEVIWIVVPLLLGLVMFAWGARLFFKQYQPPEGRSEINELHMPLGKPIKLTMISHDVIHSFYVPAFRVKQDVLPGRYTSMWFEPSKLGRYHLFCAEYCGTNHSTMRGSVTVMEPADFQSWLSQGGMGPSMAEEGERLFVQHHCAGCHRGSQTVHAPRLEGVFGRPVPILDGREARFVTADATYIRDSILLPKSQVVAGYEPVMPSYKDQISEQDLLKIIAYIKSIGPEGSAP
jgi:cytochrome c oxidase subunit 2